MHHHFEARTETEALVLIMNRWRFMVLLFLTLALACSPVAAHDLPINSIMNAFVKIEPKQADLVVRVPLDLLVPWR